MSYGRRKYLTVPYQPYRTDHTDIPHEYDFLTKIIWCYLSCPQDIPQTFHRTLEEINFVPTLEKVKEWLSRFAENERQLDNLMERIEMLRSRLEAPGSPTLSGMPRGGGDGVDMIGRKLIAIEALEEQAQGLLARSRSLYAETNRAIDEITGKRSSDLRAALKMRYLDLADWEEINIMLWSGKANFFDHVESYSRRTFRLHGEALEAMLYIVPDFQGTENKTESEEEGNGTRRTYENLGQARRADNQNWSPGSGSKAD